MADKIVKFSEADLAALRDMIRQVRSSHHLGQNRRGRDEIHGEDTATPEVYAALTPAGGIPARSGTTLGDADCAVYRVLEDYSGTGDGTFVLEAADTFDRRVLNLSTTAVAGSTYVLIQKDKYGQWWVAGGGGGGSDSSFLVLLTAKCYWYGVPGTGDCACPDDVDCDGDTGPRRFVRYSWTAVEDSSSDPDTGPPCPVRYSVPPGSTCGCPKCLPVYHPRNLYLPVFSLSVDPICCGTTPAGSGTGTGTTAGDTTILPASAAHSVVRIRRGAGDYYVMDETHPWVDFWRRTGQFDDDGLEIIYLRFYDQNTGGWVDGEEGRLVNAG